MGPIQSFNRILRCETGSGVIHWEVTDKSGVRFEYGTGTNSKLASYHLGESDHVARWDLTRVVDPNGNISLYTYMLDDNSSMPNYAGEPFRAIYPKRIDYTGYEPSLSIRGGGRRIAPFYAVDFVWTCDDASGTVENASGLTSSVSVKLDDVKPSPR